MNATDNNLLQELKASPSLAPPKQLDRTMFPKEQLDDPHMSAQQSFQENLNTWIDQDVNRPNEAAYGHWEWELRMWDNFGRKGAMPHLPSYKTIDLAKAAVWFGYENEPATRPADWDSSDHSSFVVPSTFVPAYPVIDAAPVPKPIDFKASPIGVPAGPGIYFGTPASLLAYPDEYPFPTALSPTGYLIHHVYQ